MTREHELLSRAAEQLARNPRVMGDLLLGDEIYKYLHAVKRGEVPIEKKAEQED
jgi:hypothetical protein